MEKAQQRVALVATLALAALVINFIVQGADIPAGLLGILGAIFGALFYTQAGEKNTDSSKKGDKPHEPRNR